MRVGEDPVREGGRGGNHQVVLRKIPGLDGLGEPRKRPVVIHRPPPEEGTGPHALGREPIAQARFVIEERVDGRVRVHRREDAQRLLRAPADRQQFMDEGDVHGPSVHAWPFA